MGTYQALFLLQKRRRPNSEEVSWLLQEKLKTTLRKNREVHYRVFSFRLTVDCDDDSLKKSSLS
jgi:hypothetical protein